MVGLHLAQVGAERGLLPEMFLPISVYRWMGFFTPYFDAAMAGVPVPLEFWWSFVTHAFVHGSWLHLGMNVAIFIAIGHGITRAAGIVTLLSVFFASVIGGALMHGLISGHQGLLIGASGGVFGQLGMMVVWRGLMLRRQGQSVAPVMRLVLGLLAVNVILAVGLGGAGGDNSIGGNLAWEAHLGGFIAGCLAAIALPQRRG